jgi:hypothetical protein
LATFTVSNGDGVYILPQQPATYNITITAICATCIIRTTLLSVLNPEDFNNATWKILNPSSTLPANHSMLIIWDASNVLVTADITVTGIQILG